MGTAFRRLQQGNARGHDYTECADDFHKLILRLNALSGKYDDPACAKIKKQTPTQVASRQKGKESARFECLRPPRAREGFRSFLLFDLFKLRETTAS